MRSIVSALAILFWAGAPAAFAADTLQPHLEQPLLVELFTSQGCSSCPPADEILAALAARPEVVALAFHVDYWDSIGWVDHLAIPEAVARQQAYRRSLGHDQLYTPQLVVDGRTDLPGNNPKAVAAVLEKTIAAKRPGPEISVRRAGADTATVSIASRTGDTVPDDAVVWYARLDPREVAEVKRGENRGRTIVNVNSVRVFRSLGRYVGPSWSASVEAPADAAIALWIQSPRMGPVSAAAYLGPRPDH